MGIDSVVLMLLATFMQGTPGVESQVTQQCKLFYYEHFSIWGLEIS